MGRCQVVRPTIQATLIQQLGWGMNPSAACNGGAPRSSTSTPPPPPPSSRQLHLQRQHGQQRLIRHRISICHRSFRQFLRLAIPHLQQRHALRLLHILILHAQPHRCLPLHRLCVERHHRLDIARRLQLRSPDGHQWRNHRICMERQHRLDTSRRPERIPLRLRHRIGQRPADQHVQHHRLAQSPLRRHTTKFTKRRMGRMDKPRRYEPRIRHHPQQLDRRSLRLRMGRHQCRLDRLLIREMQQHLHTEHPLHLLRSDRRAHRHQRHMQRDDDQWPCLHRPPANFCSPGSSRCIPIPPSFTPSGTLTGHLQISSDARAQGRVDESILGRRRLPPAGRLCLSPARVNRGVDPPPAPRANIRPHQPADHLHAHLHRLDGSPIPRDRDRRCRAGVPGDITKHPLPSRFRDAPAVYSAVIRELEPLRTICESSVLINHWGLNRL